MDPPAAFNESSIVECFIHIHSPASSPSMRKQADTYLIECEKQIVPLLKILMNVFQNGGGLYNAQIRLQSLLYLSNVIKRNWNNKRLVKSQSELPQLKRQISAQLVAMIQGSQRVFVKSLFDVIGFIVKSDYPHSFGEMTTYTLAQLNNIQVNDDNVRNFKALRDIFLDLAERKGFANHKNYEEGPLKILAVLGPITEGLRVEMCKIQDLNPQIARLSKYCDQMMIGLMRIAPYSYLDDQNFMLLVRHISQKLQTLLTAHNSQNAANKALLEKGIKSLIYQIGCLQVANPCMLAEILSDYIKTLFYIISKPELFTKPATIKYCVLSIRKLVKEFTYYSDNQVFEKSISSQPKSANYLQLRALASEAYRQFMTEETMQGLFNFLLTNIMNIKSKEDQGFTLGFDDSAGSATGYEKSTQKDLSVHLCGTLLVQSLIQRFPQKILQLVYNSLKACIDNNWSNIDGPTLQNFLSILSILPKSCKKVHASFLAQFPIISILQFVHGSASNRTKEKFPALICGWLDVFSNQQVGQLIEALLNYVTEGAQQNNMEILLYSCYSLNKIVTLRTAAVDCGYILNKIFPVSIKVFQHTDNPQILWPLISLISTLLTKCQFDTTIIINSIQQNSLTALITNESEMLVQALAEMFKSFLCIIPRNKPAIAVFKLIYCFLNFHLGKTQAQYHQRCVELWYFSVREFSGVNQCNQEYYQLFENHYRRCMFNLKPVLIYILEEYMLLGLIKSKLDTFINTVLQFYRQGEFLESQTEPSVRQQGTSLKIAALSFQITLITKYTIEQVNSQQILYIILKDFFNSGKYTDQATNPNKSSYGSSSGKMMPGTLQNSLLSIINRYILLYPEYFFEFLLMKLDFTPPMFYVSYFKNMGHLTSRTAMKINALALISLLPRVQDQFKPFDSSQTWPCILTILKLVIPELQTHMKTSNQGPNTGKVENSPIFRFSQSILSQRKQQIRKEGSYDNIDIRQYFLAQLQATIEKMGTNLTNIGTMVQEDDKGKNWGNRLYAICQ